MEAFQIFEDEMKELPKNPIDYIDHAYKISFDRKDLENVMKFVLDITKFCEEIFDEYLKPKTNKIHFSLKRIFTKHFDNSLNQLKNAINDFFQKNQENEFILKDLNDTVLETLGGQIKLNIMFQNKSFNSKDFQNNFNVSLKNVDKDDNENTLLGVDQTIDLLIKNKKRQLLDAKFDVHFAIQNVLRQKGTIRITKPNIC
jgi:hypothetical protein